MGQEADETAPALLKALAAAYGRMLVGMVLHRDGAFPGVHGGERVGSFLDSCGL